MKLLNLACGSVRPSGPEWVNLDNLFVQFPNGNERAQLEAEGNYVDHDLHNPLPFGDESFDGIVASHILEHLDALDCAKLLKECRRVLKVGAPILVSVPDATYFRKVNARDNRENCPELFGEPGKHITPGMESFLEYALFFLDHRQVFTEDSMWCTLKNAGFHSMLMRVLELKAMPEPLPTMLSILNRNLFSLTMSAIK